MRRVPLFARRGAIGLQDSVDKWAQWADYRPPVFDLLALRRFRTGQGLTHHPPMHSQPVRHSSDRSDAKLVLSANLLE